MGFQMELRGRSRGAVMSSLCDLPSSGVTVTVVFTESNSLHTTRPPRTGAADSSVWRRRRGRREGRTMGTKQNWRSVHSYTEHCSNKALFVKHCNPL